MVYKWALTKSLRAWFFKTVDIFFSGKVSILLKNNEIKSIEIHERALELSQNFPNAATSKT